jgi:hypothetical protein
MNPLVPDWSSFLTRAEAHLKKAENAALARDWEGMIDSLGDVQQAINGAVAWTIKRDVMEAKR